MSIAAIEQPAIEQRCNILRLCSSVFHYEKNSVAHIAASSITDAHYDTTTLLFTPFPDAAEETIEPNHPLYLSITYHSPTDRRTST
jgi:hypothetical protein